MKVTMISLKWLIFYFIVVLVQFVDSYKILGIFHTAARSHHILGSSLLKGLARKGHQVTMISPFPLKTPIKNYRDIYAPAAIEIMKHGLDEVFDENKKQKNIASTVMNFYDMGINVTDAFLNESSVQELMLSNETFDLVICEIFLNEATFGLSQHFNAPLIGISTFGAIAWNTDMVGSPSPPSYVPNPLLGNTDHMTFFQRLGNLAFATFERVFLDYFYLPKQADLFNKYFPNSKLSFDEVRKGASLVLINHHVSLGSPRPYVPNMIEVGGMHINRKPSPLPEIMQKFLDEASNGAIYFSMGSNLKSKNLPIEKRNAILNTFRSLPSVRFLWKWEESNLPGKPENVFISDWFPQDDILAHPNVKGFITHGGLLSTTESIYHGKPFIGIPMFGDQFLNMAMAEANGYGIMLDYNQLTKETFMASIEKILRERSYAQLVRDMSTRYRDQPMDPLDRAIYWVEYIGRHKGAPHLHCAGQDLSFIEYHNLDAIFVLSGVVLISILAVAMFIRLCWRLLQEMPWQGKLKEKKN